MEKENIVDVLIGLMKELELSLDETTAVMLSLDSVPKRKEMLEWIAGNWKPTPQQILKKVMDIILPSSSKKTAG